MQDMLTNQLANIVLMHADDKLMLGHIQSDWTGLAPILEEDIAASAMAQDDLSHALVLYEFLGARFNLDPDAIAFDRDPCDYRCCDLVTIPDDFDWARQQGWTVIPAEECWYKSLAPLMADIRSKIGDAPVYLSFDIDSLDPAYAPGTGTVEVGGLTSTQALEIIRGMAGLNMIGGDLVEVSPPYDPTGNTALIGANFLYEMLCALKVT